MSRNPDEPIQLIVLLTPNFNAAATVGFIDPFRAVNYLEGQVRSHVNSR